MAWKMRNRNPQVCIYCGSEADTSDHIPPRALFEKWPANGIQVPSCASCNNGASKDDEYFRLVMTSRADTGNHPEAQAITQTVMKSLERKEARGFLESAFRSLTGIELSTPGGLFVGMAPGFIADLRRLNRVAARIIAAMFFFEAKERLPDAYEAIAFEQSGPKLDQATQHQLRAAIAEVQTVPGKTIGNEVFSYWFKRSDEDPYLSTWALLFYKAAGFIGWTVRKDRAKILRPPSLTPVDTR